MPIKISVKAGDDSEDAKFVDEMLNILGINESYGLAILCDLTNKMWDKGHKTGFITALSVDRTEKCLEFEYVLDLIGNASNMPYYVLLDYSENKNFDIVFL